MGAVPTELRIDLLEEATAAAIDALRAQLGAPDNPSLFPAHFLKATFLKIGGRIVRLSTPEGSLGVGFLFPRALSERGRHYTLRLHRLDPHTSHSTWTLDVITRAVATRIGAEVTAHDVAAPASFRPATPSSEGLTIAEPSAHDAIAIRALQQQIWNARADDLYPSDLHSLEFAAGTSLIAKVDGQPAGFLFGFFEFDGPPLPARLAARHPAAFRLESQLMAVLPAHGGKGIGKALKLRQAELARRRHVHVVNWTFDPLQFVNASLNLRQLGGVVFHFHGHYYQFANDLNRTPASRVNLTWLIDAAATRTAPARRTARATALSERPDIVRLNAGAERIAAAGGAQFIAIEVPGNWTALQRDAAQRELALRWRETTDALLGEYLGPDEGRYALTDVGEDSGRCYLIGERVDDILLERLER